MTMNPAGWYADPSDPSSLRWWDGARWTESTRPAEPQPTQAAAQAGWQGGQQQPQGWGPQQPGVPGYQQQPGWPGQQPQPGWPGGQAPYGYGQAPSYQPYPQGAGAPGYGGYPGGKAVATPDGAPLAGLGARLGARIIDGLLVGTVVMILSWPFFKPWLDRYLAYAVDLTDRIAAGEQVDPFAVYSETGAYPVLFGMTAIALVLGGLYTVILLHQKGATLGKMAAGVRVRPWDAEGLPSWSQALKRYATGDLMGVMPFVGGLYSLLNVLWPLWDTRKQALHDKLPNTVVVRAR